MNTLKKSTDYKPGETEEYMEKTFTKVSAARQDYGSIFVPEIWQDEDCHDYTPTTGFTEGTEFPAFVPVVY
jgi:hypothetical protein